MRGLRQRSDEFRWRMQPNATEQVWTFRVERHDPDGSRLSPVPVELRGRAFSGTLHDGDWVRVPRGRRRGGGAVRPRRVDNLTTGETVRPAHWGRMGWVVRVLLLVLALALVAVVALYGPDLLGGIDSPAPPRVVPRP